MGNLLTDAPPIGLAFLSPDLRYRRVNEALARMNGRSVAEHDGASLEEILGSDEAVVVGDALRQVVSSRQPLELRLTVPSEEPEAARALEAAYFPLLDQEGALLGIGGIVRDVTERQELEQEQSKLLLETLLSRAQAEAAQVRANDAREEAERARTDAEAARERIAFLGRASRAMASSMDWEATLQAVVRSVVPTVADWATLTVVEPKGQLRVAALAHGDESQEEAAWELVSRYPPDPDASSGTANVIRTGEPELMTDVSPGEIAAAARDTHHRQLLEQFAVGHGAIAPLKTPGGVIGTLNLMLGDGRRPFTGEDLELISGLADGAALHIQNARLYSERSHIAETLQASLRPRPLPAIPGTDLAARFLPAGDHNEVGGDFYDVSEVARPDLGHSIGVAGRA